MYVVELLPLAKSVRAESLSYFSPKPVAAGTLVTAPMQNREISGVVASCVAAKDVKASLKTAGYEMKQINEIGKQIFFAHFIIACRSFARFSGVTAGSTIKALTPTQVIRHNEDLPEINSDIFLPEITAPQPKIIQATEKKQVDYINSLVQRRLADNESIFVCTPTTQQAAQLETAIDTKATIIRLDSTLTKNTLLSRWREVVTTKNPVVIVGTVPFLSVPRADLGLIVVTDEVNDAYKMMERPYLDKRLFARHLAQEIKRDCVLAGNLLTTETLWEYRNDRIGQVFKPSFHYNGDLERELIDMKELASPASGIKLFSPPVAQEIRKTASSSRKLLLFVARRGRRPFTVCNDCGETVVCDRCQYPLVLIEDEAGERRYVCRTCGQIETSLRRCQSCSSWRLEALGVGIDFVAEALREKIPELSVFQVDSDSLTSEKQLEKTLDDFAAADSGVLLTTQLGVNRLEYMVDSSVVVSADSLVALPDLSIAEKLFALLLRIREHTAETFLIQTRASHTDIFSQALEGDVTSFYRQQIAQREKFNYPPFSYLIKFTASGKEARVRQDMRKLKQLFADENLSMYPGGTGGDFTAHALLQIDRERWVDDELLSKLYSLPLSVAINAHPRSLL